MKCDWRSGKFLSVAAIASWLLFAGDCPAQHPLAASGGTSLTDPTIEYRVTEQHHVTMNRGPLTAVVADNEAIDIAELPGHRAGYNGLASLTHQQRPQNLFVPSVAGLNFEHIHDGTADGLVEKFEPRKFPMELRIISDHIVELYQPPTGNWRLESCGRYELLEDGGIEYTFECIPRADDYRRGFIGLFWASYIHQPEDKAIRFRGIVRSQKPTASWITAVSPQHGIDSTHPPDDWQTSIEVDDDFPLTLVNHPSRYRHTEAWYYGVSHGMAFVQMFRPRDQIWIAQSPSGGGQGNPAWDFQWFIPTCEVDQSYGFRMRAAYLPYQSRRQIIDATEHHREALRSE